MPLDCDLCSLYSESAVRNLLSFSEYTRYKRFRVPGKKNEFLHSRLLLQSLIIHYTPYQPQDVQIIPDGLGKPFFFHNSKRILPFFNLAHTEGMIVCAIGHIEQLGCDIEILRENFDTDQLIHHVLCPAEIVTYQSLPDIQRQLFFFKLWTVKEAYTKALGQGLHIPMESLHVVNVITDGELNIIHSKQHPNSAYHQPHWFLRLFTPTPHSILALAASITPSVTFFQAALDHTQGDFPVEVARVNWASS